jgi:DNA-3-methyladenine glycosylase
VRCSAVTRRPLPRAFYNRPVLDVARDVLGAVIEHAGVQVRLTEIEAYDKSEPASHSFRGQTPRTAVMFGPPGHAYVYFVYGMHFCVNLVCGPTGTASALLLRAGEVVSGLDLATARRPQSKPRDLARGPGRLTQVLAIDSAQNGVDVTRPGSPLRVFEGTPVAAELICEGPRIGITKAVDLPWRFWIDGDPSVSPYRAYSPKRR